MTIVLTAKFLNFEYMQGKLYTSVDITFTYTHIMSPYNYILALNCCHQDCKNNATGWMFGRSVCWLIAIGVDCLLPRLLDFIVIAFQMPWLSHEKHPLPILWVRVSFVIPFPQKYANKKTQQQQYKLVMSHTL